MQKEHEAKNVLAKLRPCDQTLNVIRKQMSMQMDSVYNQIERLNSNSNDSIWSDEEYSKQSSVSLCGKSVSYKKLNMKTLD